MDQISLDEFSRHIDGRLIDGGTAMVARIAVHSSRVRSGSAFFALAGTQVDGHTFVEQAHANGAVAAVVSHRRAAEVPSGLLPLVVVDDPLYALQGLAAWWRSQLQGTVIATVGSVGKTITKDALVHVATSAGYAYGSPGSYNSQLGVALALLECPRNCSIAVIEAAATAVGEMSRLRDIIRPNHVVLTNLTKRHASAFGDRETHAREILSIATGMDATGWLLFGTLRDELASIAHETSDAAQFVRNGSNLMPRFSAAERTRDGLTTHVVFPGGTTGKLSIRNPSEEILFDVELAISAAWLLGVDAPAVLSAVAAYTPVATRMEIWQSPGGATLVRDLATGDSVALESALRTARNFRGDTGRTIAVLGDPLAQGTASTARSLGQSLAGSADAVYGLELPTHHLIAESVRRANSSVPVDLFDDIASLRDHLLDTLHHGDVALIEPSRVATIADVSSALMDAMATTRLNIDLSAIESNVMAIRRLIGPATSVMAVVKARAYGTSSAHISSCLRLQEAGVDFLGVAAADEGVDLRRAGIGVPILVLLGTPEEIDKMVLHRLTPLVYSPEMLEAVVAAAERVESPLPVHLEVDSGMHRTGFLPEEAISALRRIRDVRTVRLEGLMTHLGCAEIVKDDAYTLEQLARFQDVVDAAYSLGFADFIRHAANTAATIRFPSSHFDMVRIGLGLFGLYPSAATRELVPFVPAVSLVSRIVETYPIEPGERVGYGGTFRAPVGGTRIGVVPAGYDDCLPRAFSNFGHVIVAGKRCPIIGSISMDSMTIDLSRAPEADVGSDVVIYGRQGEVEISIENVAKAIGTIPWELMTSIGTRVQRIFTRH